MKKILAAAAAATLSLAAFAADDTPRIDARQARQEQRIDQGVASGQLTRSETRRLTRQQQRIDQAENLAQADGTVTRRERAALTQAQNRTSRHIHRQKHDAQARPAAQP